MQISRCGCNGLVLRPFLRSDFSPFSSRLVTDGYKRLQGVNEKASERPQCLITILDILRSSGESACHLRKGNIMILTLATLALVSVPLVIDLYFNIPSESDSVEDEYVPDGR